MFRRDGAANLSRPSRTVIQERGLTRRIDAMELARYIVSVIEGAILLARDRGDRQLITRQFAFLKEHLRNCLGS